MYAMILSLAMLAHQPMAFCNCPSRCVCADYHCLCEQSKERCIPNCPCDVAFVRQAVPPKKDDAPKSELKSPNGCTFTKTARGGILLRPDGSVEVIFDYGREVQQKDIDEWFAKKGQVGDKPYPGYPGYIYGDSFGGASGGCANGSCGGTSSGRGFFRRR